MHQPEPAGTSRLAAVRRHPAAQVLAASSVAGVALGVAWWLVAPVARFEERAGTVVQLGQGSETAVAADGWFAVCAAVVGVIAGLLAALLVRRDRLVALLSLTAGGVLGSVLAWQLGELLGQAPVEARPGALEDGARVVGPLRLSALGVLLTWPMTAVMVFFGAVAGLDAADHGDPARPGERALDQVSQGGGSVPSAPT